MRHYAEIYASDVDPRRLANTQTAKSVHDAGWPVLRKTLSYESIATGGVMRAVSERYSSPNVLGLRVHSRKQPEGVGCVLRSGDVMNAGRRMIATSAVLGISHCRGGTSPR